MTARRARRKTKPEDWRSLNPRILSRRPVHLLRTAEINPAGLVSA